MNTNIAAKNAVEAPTNALYAMLGWQSVLHQMPWYAVLDAAQNSSLPRRASDAGLRVESLYAARLGAMLDDVAPHLVSLDLQSPFVDWLLERWDRNYGIFLQSTAPFDTLRKHFRKFLMVKDEAGKKYRFRFYDPRILRAFLPACTPDELKQFFGPIERLYTPTRDGRGVLVFSPSDRGVRVVDLTGRMTAQAVANEG